MHLQLTLVSEWEGKTFIKWPHNVDLGAQTYSIGSNRYQMAIIVASVEAEIKKCLVCGDQAIGK